MPSLRRALFLGTLLVLVDAFFINQGVLSAIVALWLVLVSLPRTFLARKFAAVRTARLRNIGIYLAAVVLVLGFNAANNRLARSRAEELVAAVRAFRAVNQRYPRTLQELVPAYIEKVPLAKYTLAFNRFTYFTAERGTNLFYVAVPPYGRPTYSFDRDSWSYLD